MTQIPKLHFNDKYNYDVIKLYRQRQLKKSSLVGLYKDKTFEHYYLDQLLNIICLYLEECNNEEILFWLKNDWNIKLKLEELKLILKKLSCRRLFPKTRKFNIIKDKSLIDGFNFRPDIINYKGFLFTTNTEYQNSFLYYREGFSDENGRGKIKIGNTLSFIEYINENGEYPDLVDVLNLKRFSNAYGVSDFDLIELWSEFHEVNIPKAEINKLLYNAQNNFIKEFLEVNKRIRG